VCVNIDGVPIFRDAHGLDFWPIPGAIDRYPVFLIGIYSGTLKPHCPNAFIRPFMKEVLKLEEEGFHLPIPSHTPTSNNTIPLECGDNCGLHVYRFSLYHDT